MSFFFFFTILSSLSFSFFFFNDTATTEIYTLSLHDALPIFAGSGFGGHFDQRHAALERKRQELRDFGAAQRPRSEEHTSELQSQSNLVCRLLLEKKKKNTIYYHLRITYYLQHASTAHRSRPV